MESTTLYRKYRPKTFSEVVGQEPITNTLAREVLSEKIGHAYLFCGTRGTGKTSVAKIFARAVNCENLQENGDPCNKCDSCVGLLNNTIMDVAEIDAASNNGVDDVRALRSEVVYAPSAVKYRVYIIDEVHMMTASAFNALLKTLEEPPSHVIFVLATTEAHKVPMTIQSRCQRFDFRRISIKDISSNLQSIAEKDGFVLSPEAAEIIATVADGAMRDALSMLELCKSSGDVTLETVHSVLGVASGEKYFELANAINNEDIGAALSAANEIMGRSGDAGTLVAGMLTHFRDLAMCKHIDEPTKIMEKPAEIINKLKAQANNFEDDKIISCMQKLCDIMLVGKVGNMTKTLAESGIIMMCTQG